MKRIVWSVAILVLGLAACSSLDNSPRLEAQFGTADDDIGIDVSVLSTGKIYVLGQGTGPVYKDLDSGGQFLWGDYQRTTMRQYGTSGNLASTRILNYSECEQYCNRVYPVSFDVGSSGQTYIIHRSSFPGEGDAFPAYTTYLLSAYGSDGYLSWTRALGNGKQDYPDITQYAADTALDRSGFIYAVVAEGKTDWGGDEPVNSIAKYSPSNGLQWQRVSTVGYPYGIAVNSSNSVYVIGASGMSRFSNAGNLIWTKTGASYAVKSDSDIVAVSSNVYVRNLKTVRKYDLNGKLIWSKEQSGLNTLIGQDLSGDTSGNIYLSGKYNAGSGNYNPFVRKINSSGSVLWTKTYGTSSYDDARGIATINGSEIYVTGETQGSLSHTNIGGRDGYLRKLNSSGTLVWSK